MSNDKESVHIKRSFDAPIEVIWAMWTDPAKFQQWYGPMGMSVPLAEMDVTIGGTRKICMEMITPDQTMQMWFIGEYKEIVAPTRLVYTESMCDAAGNIIKPEDMGMPPGSPDVTEVIVELQSEGNQTMMTMTHRGVPAGSPGEGGWKQAFDKLAEYLPPNA